MRRVFSKQVKGVLVTSGGGPKATAKDLSTSRENSPEPQQRPLVRHAGAYVLESRRRDKQRQRVHFAIMGCGRVGSLIAITLDVDGHSVAIINMDPKAFSRLSANFSGRRVTGFGMGRDALRQTGIKDTYVFMAMSSGDNSNVITARITQEVFHAKRVVTRIYGPQRAFVYEHLSIPMVTTVKRTAESMMRCMLPPDASIVWTHPTGGVSLVIAIPEESWYDMAFPTIEELTGEHIAFVSRLRTIIPARPDPVIQEHDQPHFMVAGNNSTRLHDILTNEPDFQD